jgi:predicted Rossmann-fold nucleotide-binding protein
MAASKMKLVSGGQTGVDRAALDVALEAGLPCGGWCPAGRGAEDGPIPAHYPLRETPSADPAERTSRNVRDSDATLVLLRGAPAGGTAHTLAEAARLGKPVCLVDLEQPIGVDGVSRWLDEHAVTTLNVAGPRESEAPEIYEAAREYLHRLVGS